MSILDQSKIDPGEAYGIAKRANQLRVEIASIDWGFHGGRTISISPGIISTPMTEQELAGPLGIGMQGMIALSGAKRIGTPIDIAKAVNFLVSERATYITGTDLLVDGGVVAFINKGVLLVFFAS